MTQRAIKLRFMRYFIFSCLIALLPPPTLAASTSLTDEQQKVVSTLECARTIVQNNLGGLEAVDEANEVLNELRKAIEIPGSDLAQIEMRCHL